MIADRAPVLPTVPRMPTVPPTPLSERGCTYGFYMEWSPQAWTDENTFVGVNHGRHGGQVGSTVVSPVTEVPT